MLGLAVAASFAVPATVLTATNTYAQTQGVSDAMIGKTTALIVVMSGAVRKKRKVVRRSYDDQSCEVVWR